MKCRHCGNELNLTFLDLGTAPPSNAYLAKDDLKKPEVWFPLKLLVCDKCWLVQTEDYANREQLFTSDYAYFSSTSKSWLDHAKNYVEGISSRLKIDKHSHVVEIASNDGYLLQYFKQRNIPCLGIEPTKSTAEAARQKGIEVVEEFFGVALAKRLKENEKLADLIIGNNVLAHVPDINDFVSGVAELLKPQGTVTFEFPHLVRMIEGLQFDTVYHEHFSYLSFTTVKQILTEQGLKIYDVEELETHGGSLRVYAQLEKTGRNEETQNVKRLLNKEEHLGVMSEEYYQGFQEKVMKVKHDFLSFLLEAKELGKRVIGYGAAAKGNTLLNFAGVTTDLIEFVCDAAPSKQNKYMPGSRLPILKPEFLEECRPDIVFIFPWNISTEIKKQLLSSVGQYTKFYIGIPSIMEL